MISIEKARRGAKIHGEPLLRSSATTSREHRLSQNWRSSRQRLTDIGRVLCERFGIQVIRYPRGAGREEAGSDGGPQRCGDTVALTSGFMKLKRS
jgi:hypothetical protein